MEDLNDDFEGVSLGERLRGLREQAGMSMEGVAREMKTSSRHVRALEQGDWHAFSAKVYAQGAVRQMTKALQIAEPDALVILCAREWDIAYGIRGDTNHRTPRAVARPRRFMVTPRRMGAGAAVGMAVLLIVFLGARLLAFTAAPGLTIQRPADQGLFDAPIVRVTGKTEKESSLTVNGRELTLDEQGNFDEEIELQSGANELHFISRNRFGKTQTAVRNIFVE